MANSKIYTTIVLLSVVVSGILSQNAQPVPNQLGANPTPPSPTPTTTPPSPTPAPPVPECKLVSTKPSASADRQTFKVVNKGADQKEMVCLLAEFKAVVLINENPAQYLDLGKGTMVASPGLCDPENKKINLAVNYECGQIQLSIEGNQTVSVNSLTGIYTVGNETHHYVNAGPLFKTTKAGYYYRCNSEQNVPIKLLNETSTNSAALLMTNVGFETFPDKNQDSFTNPPEICEADTKPVSDLVPIAVGACLAALVVIVLIAYFVGRRRWSERSTYESV